MLVVSELRIVSPVCVVTVGDCFCSLKCFRTWNVFVVWIVSVIRMVAVVSVV